MALQPEAYWGFKYPLDNPSKQLAAVKRAGYVAKDTRLRKSNDSSHHLRRMERQLPNYRKSTGKVLCDFALARGVIGKDDEKPKRELVAVLEAADEDCTFSRFMDLSPELRCHIYGW